MDSPTLTAVLPTFNRSPSFDAAVNSALGQSVQDLELIVVDDASQVEFRPRAENYADPRLKIIQRSSNGGVAAAQNSGLNHARGEFISFIHSDDVWLPGRLEAQLEALRAYPKASAVESATLRIGREFEVELPPQLRTVTHDMFLSRKVRNIHIAGWTFRTDAIREVGGFDESLRAYEDFDLLARLLRQHTFIFTDSAVARLDQRGSDRLSESPWMAVARSTLLEKYEPLLVETFGRLPNRWRDWAVMLAIAALEDAEPGQARRHLRSANRGRHFESLKRTPLYLSSFGGRRISALGARAARHHY